MQPNQNLNLLHCVLFTAAMLAIFFWGVAALEADLAASRSVATAIMAVN